MLDLRPHESYNLCLYCICQKAPTYVNVELIDLVEEAENHCDHIERLPVNLIQIKLYWFYVTIVWIVAPKHPSLIGGSRLTGAQLISYRKRSWEPRYKICQK